MFVVITPGLMGVPRSSSHGHQHFNNPHPRHQSYLTTQPAPTPRARREIEHVLLLRACPWKRFEARLVEDHMARRARNRAAATALERLPCRLRHIEQARAGQGIDFLVRAIGRCKADTYQAATRR